MSVTFKGKEVKVGDVLYLATIRGVSEEKIKKLGPKMVEVVSDDNPSADRYHVVNYFSKERNLFWEKSEACAVRKLFDLSVIFREIKDTLQDQFDAGKFDEKAVDQAIEKAEEIFVSLKKWSL